jgi:acetyltransferase-like isoleucine patch superfamily enzyme
MLNELKILYSHLRDAMKEKWRRDLPFDELLFDRWERAKDLGFGEGTSIYHNSYVYGDVKVGKNTWIGPFTILDGSGGLEIGDNCSISAGVHIYSHNTVLWAVSMGKEAYERKPVKIGSGCFIGPNSVIKNGVAIGRQSVIGSNSFVNRDVPSYSIVGGSPARSIGKVVITDDGQVTFVFNEGKHEN